MVYIETGVGCLIDKGFDFRIAIEQALKIVVLSAPATGNKFVQRRLPDAAFR